VALTFSTFCYSLVIFRAPSLHDAGTMLGRMLTGASGLASRVPVRAFWLAALAVALGHLLGQRGVLRRLRARRPVPVQGMALGCLLTVALLLAPDASKAFVYFQF